MLKWDEDTLQWAQIRYLEYALPLLSPLNTIFEWLYKVWSVTTSKSETLISFCLDCIDQAHLLLQESDYKKFQQAQKQQKELLETMRLQEQQEQLESESLLDDL